MFPSELKTLKNWVGYKLPGKEPINPVTGLFARSNDRSTWGTYAEAIGATKKFNLPGVGFMFEPPYLGIDLDDCVENGVVNDYAKDIILKCNSYTELSPSRTGIHIIGKGHLDRAIKTKEIEIYNKERYFTVTGKVLYPIRQIKEIDVAKVAPRQNQAADNKDGWVAEVLNNVGIGSRNNDFTRIAGSLRARGYSGPDIFNLLISKAREVEFGEFELKTICDSVSRYEPKFKEEAAADSIESFLQDIETVEWIVPGIIARNALHFVAGLNGTMKTWSLIDLAIECAKGGGLWLNKFPVEKAKVLFIDQERFKGETQRRFKAVLSAKEKLKNMGGLQLYIKSGTTTRLDLQHSFDAFKKEVSGLKPDLIIVDSFATFHTKNENLRQEIQVVLERIKELRNEFGCSFVFIHHENGSAYSKEDNDSPNTGQMAGSEAIPAAADVVLTVRKQDNESSMIYMTKNNLSPSIAPFLVKVIDLNDERTKIKVEGY